MRSLFLRSILLGSLFLLSGISYLIAQKSNLIPLVKVKGNQFVDRQDKPLILRGLALSDPDKLYRAGHWNEDYFRRARDWGANVVRIPIHPDRWRRLGEKGYLELLDQGVEWAKKYQMLVIVDWHVIGNFKTELFQDAIYDTTRKETHRFWQVIAVHYKNEPVVAFYEIFNEPTTYNEQLGDWSWAEWKSQAETIIKIILANNPIAIPLVGGLDWDYDLTPIGKNPINIPGVGYTVHPYPQKRPQPWEEKWEKDFGYLAEKYPVFATEFGFERKGFVPCIGTPEYGRHLIDYFSRKGISWTVWCFDPNWFPTLFSDWNFTPTEQGEFFRNELKKLNQ
jgi:endoglucanase